ncbi:hypothetical protein [Budvicia diplopodorum]|uniref:hypothetical protein n=1 Tax=Budvicia diplopodorum TaxID=1119056 RepID=UPI0013591F7C|nr:hypothetical protein [Budvicia diplopodorum]
MSQTYTDQSTQLSNLKIAQCVTIVTFGSTFILFIIAKLFPGTTNGITYRLTIAKPAESEWEPMMLALQFGVQYFLALLLVVGVAISLLFFFSCRDEKRSK